MKTHPNHSSNEFKRDLYESEIENVKTFYEKAIDIIPVKGNHLKLAIASFFLIVTTFGINLILSFVCNENIFDDYSYLLSIMHGVCLFTVVKGTTKLKRFGKELKMITKDQSNQYLSKTFINIIKKHLNNYKLLPWGIFFGVLNTLIGRLFGSYHNHLLTSFYLDFQHLLIGFLAGTAIGGIYTILVMVDKLSKSELKLNFYHPDKCCGTSSIGNLLFFFAMITLIMGLFISNYIQLSWSIKNFNLFQIFVFDFWIAWPFIASTLVFLFPVVTIFTKVKKYKTKELLLIRKKIEQINNKIILINPEKEDSMKRIESLLLYSEKLKSIDEIIENTNSWPYSKIQYRTFFSTLPITAFANPALKDIFDVLEKLKHS